MASIEDALFAWKSGYREAGDFTRRGMSPRYYDKAIKEGYIEREQGLPAGFGVRYRLTEKGKAKIDAKNAPSEPSPYVPESRADKFAKRAKLVMEVATPEQKKVLDDFQAGTEQLFLMYLDPSDKGVPITKEKIESTLQIMVNSVEGDTSQLEDEHAKYAKKKGWLKGFDLPSYAYGGRVRRTGYAKVHKGELVIPASTVQKIQHTQSRYGLDDSSTSLSDKRYWNRRAKETHGGYSPRAHEQNRRLEEDRGQGGYFRHRKEHSINRRKARRR